MEGHYQANGLFVDAYQVAIGIEQTPLSNDQWVVLLEHMPNKRKEVVS